MNKPECGGKEGTQPVANRFNWTTNESHNHSEDAGKNVLAYIISENSVFRGYHWAKNRKNYIQILHSSW